MSPRQRWTDDRALVDACLAGDESAWETLVRRYQRLIFSVPVGYRIQSGDAEDIFQRVAVKLFENLSRLRRIEGLPAWLVITTRRECQAFLRGARRSSSIDDVDSGSLAEDPPDVAEALDAVVSEDLLVRALERMDETCRVLLEALYLEEPVPPYKEIARRLGRSIGSLGPTRARCLKKLQKLYVELGGERP